ncbi:vacuolar protein sorting-associated protein Ist1 [Artemisia annua]|uniref:Vacuolar protein sorting-associated protein Ist1 n=1 Tax=Artemisia annua TaxID=35608 RepID=A0A2U1PHU0_ARTAN|nr:vacuolar protein sorting-associated protein Ist1 [Artemisia annua]
MNPHDFHKGGDNLPLPTRSTETHHESTVGGSIQKHRAVASETVIAGECPLDLKEAILSLCFAAPRCEDLPKLIQVQMAFAGKYGTKFVAAATELMPECGVNRQRHEIWKAVEKLLTDNQMCQVRTGGHVCVKGHSKCIWASCLVQFNEMHLVSEGHHDLYISNIKFHSHIYRTVHLCFESVFPEMMTVGFLHYRCNVDAKCNNSCATLMGLQGEVTFGWSKCLLRWERKQYESNYKAASWSLLARAMDNGNFVQIVDSNLPRDCNDNEMARMDRVHNQPSIWRSPLLHPVVPRAVRCHKVAQPLIMSTILIEKRGHCKVSWKWLQFLLKYQLPWAQQYPQISKKTCALTNELFQLTGRSSKRNRNNPIPGAQGTTVQMTAPISTPRKRRVGQPRLDGKLLSETIFLPHIRVFDASSSAEISGPPSTSMASEPTKRCRYNMGVLPGIPAHHTTLTPLPTGQPEEYAPPSSSGGAPTNKHTTTKGKGHCKLSWKRIRFLDYQLLLGEQYHRMSNKGSFHNPYCSPCHLIFLHCILIRGNRLMGCLIYRKRRCER